MKILVLVYVGQAGPFVMMDLADIFRQLGHETLMIKVKDIIEMQNKFGDTAYDEVARNIKNLGADFAIGYGGTANIYFKLADDTVLNLFESLGIPFCSIYYDNPMEGKIFPLVAAALYSKLQHIFIWDRYYVEELKKLGFRNVYYMPIAANTKRYYKVPDQARDANRYTCDVSFVGAWSLKRELLLSRLLPFDLTIYGYWWENARDVMSERFRGQVDNVSELPLIYNCSKVNLNATMEQGVTSLNMRVFDCLACEGFLITDYKKDLEELFDIEKEIVCYHDADDMVQLVSYYLTHDNARKEKAKLGRQRVLRDHTYKKRGEFILNTLRESGIGN